MVYFSCFPFKVYGAYWWESEKSYFETLNVVGLSLFATSFYLIKFVYFYVLLLALEGRAIKRDEY